MHGSAHSLTPKMQQIKLSRDKHSSLFFFVANDTGKCCIHCLVEQLIVPLCMVQLTALLQNGTE
jgi:hypothetical protein